MASSPLIRLVAVSPSTNIRQDGSISGSNAVSIAAARNETESFQVVVSPTNGALREVDASVSELRNAAGDTLPARCVDVFCNVFVPIRTPDPRSDMPPGMWADALVPRTNPYTGEPVAGPQWEKHGWRGERFRGRGYDVWENQQQPIWVDIRVPYDAAPGVYTGSITVTASNAAPASMPIEIEVWDFALPDGPTLENHFGGFERAAKYYGIATDSEEYLRLEDRFIEMLVAHRINPPFPHRLRPQLDEDGSVTFNDELDRRITEFVAKYHVTNIEVPRAPYRDMLGADRDKAARFYQSWYAYLNRKGWADRAYLYMFDECLHKESYDRVRQLGPFVEEAEPRLRRLVVEAPYPRDPSWGTLDGNLDIWVSLFGYIDEASTQRVLKAGDEMWLYTALVQSIPKFHPDFENIKEPDLPHWDPAAKAGRPPYWEMDFPLLSYRIAPWLNRRYDATGLLYWSSCYWFKKGTSTPQNPWDNPTFGDHWNGEGFFVYPGADAGIDGLVASARLKNLRDGMEDYEYFALLASLGDDDIVREVVREAVPTWGSWCRDDKRLANLRRRLAKEIVRRK